MLFEKAVEGVSGLITGVLDRVWPNPTEQERAKLETLKLIMANELAIHATNEAEARHPSVFVAGWRPAIGWICASGFGYAMLLRPFLVWASLNLGMEIPPSIEVGELIALMAGMLGFGAYRTFEGTNGVKRSGWKSKEGFLPQGGRGL